MDEIKEILKELGFTEKEAEVYLFLYKNPESRIVTIQRELKMDRSTITKLLTRMINKNYVISVKNDKNIITYSVVDPKILYNELKSKEEKMKELIDKLRKYKVEKEEEFKIRFNKGKNIVKKVLDEIIFDEKPYMILGGEVGCEVMERENLRFVNLANRLKIPGRILSGKSKELFIGKYEDLRFIPYKSEYSIYIWNNKVAYIFWHSPYYSLVIHNPTTYKSHKALFDLIWHYAEKPKKGDIKVIK